MHMHIYTSIPFNVHLVSPEETFLPIPCVTVLSCNSQKLFKMFLWFPKCPQCEDCGPKRRCSGKEIEKWLHRVK